MELLTLFESLGTTFAAVVVGVVVDEGEDADALVVVAVGLVDGFAAAAATDRALPTLTGPVQTSLEAQTSWK